MQSAAMDCTKGHRPGWLFQPVQYLADDGGYKRLGIHCHGLVLYHAQ